MIDFTNTVEISRPKTDVFAYLADFEHNPEWNWAVATTRKVGDGPIQVGTRYVQTRTLPQPGTETFRITSFAPPHAIAIAGTLGPFQARLRYELTGSDPGVVTLTNSVELDGGGILRAVGPLFARRVERSVSENLQVLRDLLESRSRPEIAGI